MILESDVFEPNLRNVQGVAILCGVRDGLLRILLRRSFVIWVVITRRFWTKKQRSSLKEQLAYTERSMLRRRIRNRWRRVSLKAIFWHIYPWGRFWMRLQCRSPRNRQGLVLPLWKEFCALPSHH